MAADKSPEQITIDALNNENATLKAKVSTVTAERDEANKAVDKATKALAQATEASRIHTETMKGVEKTIKTQADDLTEAEKLIADLTEKLANATAGKDANSPTVVTHDGDQYRVLAKQVQVAPGKVLTAAQLSEDKETVAKLIASGSGLLQKIEKPA